jgi:hypothetical protein
MSQHWFDRTPSNPPPTSPPPTSLDYESEWYRKGWEAGRTAALREVAAARASIAFLRSCVRSGESLTAEDDARIDALLRLLDAEPAGGTE